MLLTAAGPTHAAQRNAAPEEDVYNIDDDINNDVKEYSCKS